MKIVWGRSIGFNLMMNGKPDLWGRTVQVTDIITDGCDCYPWTEFFSFLPRKTITGKRIFWEKAYKRKVWVVWSSGFHMEPEIQYATLFDVLTYEDAKA